ncbi:MAG: hypothetical protein COB84_03500 [Rhodobacteraceae bacterium]|nr:MAG: hypothetical protein COB84_03500 [Paracoccaceae bacterium]
MPQIAKIILIVLLCAATFSAAPNTDQYAPQKVALVFGNSGYDFLPNLKNAQNDAVAMSRVLSDNGYTVFLVQNGTAEQTKNALRIFNDESKNAQHLLFYYAGHSNIQNGQPNLLPTDYNPNQPSTDHSAFTLSSIIAPYQNRLLSKAFIIDACLEFQGNSSSLIIPAGMGIETLYSFSTSAGHVAYDGIGSHGLFTGALLDQIIMGTNDLQLTLRIVRKSVMKASNLVQIPITLSTLSEPFSLNKYSSTSLQGLNNDTIHRSLSSSGYADRPLLGTLSLGIDVNTR